jgi:hypothetical protein
MSRKSFHANNTCFAVAASTTASARAANTSTGFGTPEFRVTNSSSQLAFVTFGTSTVTATFPTTATPSSGYVIGGNETQLVRPGKTATYAAAIMQTSSGTIYFEPGFIQ